MTHSIYKVNSKQNLKSRHFAKMEKTILFLCFSGVCSTFPVTLLKWKSEEEEEISTAKQLRILL